jgi:hypothetical protein
VREYCFSVIGLLFGLPASAADPLEFDRDVAPLLAARCLDCHNATDEKGGLDLTGSQSALAGGDGGIAIVAGNPEDSPLWQRVRDGEMPPKTPLSEAEKSVFRRWISGGAKWGTDPIDRYRFTGARRAGYDWWALQPVRRSTPPTLPGDDWSRTAIDRFVFARLADVDLSPSREAHRRTLIRRLTLDLLGLPPSPADVEAFVADERPDAFERLVDRLLASPQYGERWARHWLDVVRFGESQGFERDKLREHAWPYRDWVVRAFNEDRPFDEFARLQIAGDVLRPGTVDGIEATGFLVAGPYDEVGQNQQSAAMRAVVRQDELEDYVGVVGQSFLGLTVHCARCHDHKFDPVRQEEYYRLAAALAGVRHGERSLKETVPRAWRERATELRRALDAQRDAVLAALDVESPGRRSAAPRPFASWSFDEDVRDAVGALHGELRDGARLEFGQLLLDGRRGHVTTAPLSKSITAKTLEVWVRLNGLDQRGGGVLGVQTLDGSAFDAIVFGEREPKRWMAGSDHFRRTQDLGGPDETDAADSLTHVAIVYGASGTIQAYRNGRPYGKAYDSEGPVTFEAGKAQVVFGVRHTPPGDNKMLAGAVDRANLYDRALTAAEVAASANVETEAVVERRVLDALPAAESAERVKRRAELDEVLARIRRREETSVYAVTPKPPGPTHVLRRGNPGEEAEIVAAGGVASLGDARADFGLPADAAESARRTRLAEWVTSEHNPLFARVAVNRLWHHHFGTGLVDTPSDFGFNGGRPTHPELLDWLASELVRSGWSVKYVQRLIVTSAVYRQESLSRGAALAVDADNRLLWRFSPRRLEAEVLRDAILAVAGELNTAMGGPGYRDFTTYVRNAQFYEPTDPVGFAFQRRTLYRTWVRSGRSQFLDVFDCPDPSTRSPDRDATTTPLQALSLMNDSFVLRMADRCADAVTAEVGDDPAGQVSALFRRALGRQPTDDELAATVPFVRGHGLAALVRVVFNGNEFVFVE